MNSLLLLAASLAFILGLIHSILGEKLIFKRLRKDSLIPTQETPLLREAQLRIIRATWHLATILAWGIAAILFQLSSAFFACAINDFLQIVLALCMFSSSLLVLVATKGKHPGWIVLLAIGILLCLA